MLRRPRTWLVALAAAIAIAAVLSGPRMRRVLSRWLKVGRLGGRSFARAATHRLRVVTASADQKVELQADFRLRTAEDVALTLGNMKGAFMKLGQMLSFVDDGLPEEFRAALAQLQDSAPPMSGDLAAQVIRDELGDSPTKLFRNWDPEPIAAASIGQVHRAVLDDGTPVAVKVQYPGIAEVVEADLAHLELGRFTVPMIWPNLDAAAIGAELRERLTEELDYRIEAANQHDFARWYEGHPFIRVPSVVDGLSARRVLTTSFHSGERFAAMEKRPQADRDWAAEVIFRFVFRSLHDYLAFNGDPHPGNYLFGDGEVAFVDFGMVKRLTPSVRDTTVGLAVTAAIDPDPKELRRLCEEFGYFIPGNPLPDEIVSGFSGILWSYLADDKPTTLTSEWASETVRTYLLKGPEYREVDKWGGLPRDSVILQRITVGLLAVLGRLHATANWHRIARELWLGEGPATPLGELEAEWSEAVRRRLTSTSDTS